MKLLKPFQRRSDVRQQQLQVANLIVYRICRIVVEPDGIAFEQIIILLFGGDASFAKNAFPHKEEVVNGRRLAFVQFRTEPQRIAFADASVVASRKCDTTLHGYRTA